MALPADASPSCVVDPATFSAWQIADAGAALPGFRAANSVGFPTDNTACDFYTWGAQMFLWLTSEAGTRLVLNSPGFFNVLPPDAAHQRTLEANVEGTPIALELRAGKFDEIGEVGQAGGGGVLMSQAGSLVYYGIHVNDLYAYFLTGQRAGVLTEDVFPRNAADEADVTAYVRANFPDATLDAPDALAMELKTSWVDLATIPVASRGLFLTMDAQVPTYSRSPDNMTWTPDGLQTITLALVGIHVVGSVQNHPELVWITYEHVLNAPDADYYYMDGAGNVVLHPYDAAGTYLFMATNGTQDGANVECMNVAATGAITAVAGTPNTSPVCAGGIVPSNTFRSYPWGSPANSQDAAVVANNTLLLSINDSIRSQLAEDDARRHYVMTGGIWTSAPSATADAPIPEAPPFTAGDLRGSLFAFNVTMETYRQGTNCFSCHSVPNTAGTPGFAVSHIYSQILPLALPAP